MMHGASLRTPRRKRRRQASRAAATQRSDAKDSKAEDGKDGSARAWTTIDEMRAQADATSATRTICVNSPTSQARCTTVSMLHSKGGLAVSSADISAKRARMIGVVDRKSPPAPLKY